MNYSETVEFLYSSMPSFQDKGATAYKPGLERVAEFCRKIGNPQRNYFVIHVAGTNGKGSVSHILASILQQAGYRLLGVGGMIVFPIAAMLFKQLWDHSGLQPDG